MLSDIKGLITILRATHTAELQSWNQDGLKRSKMCEKFCESIQYLLIIAFKCGPVTSSKTLKAVD